MIIYKTINLLNGKVYVGKDEKNNPNYYGSGKILKRSIVKYGLENFKKEILDECDNRNELNLKEKYWIKFLNTKNNGYNLTDGGTGGRTKNIPVYQYNKDGQFIKKWDSSTNAGDELGIENSGIRKVCKNKLFSCGGFIWNENFYPNGVNPYKNNREKEILQYDKNGNFIKEWKSFYDVKRAFNVSDWNGIDNPRRLLKGFIWIRKKNNIELKIIIPKRTYNKKNKKNE